MENPKQTIGKSIDIILLIIIAMRVFNLDKKVPNTVNVGMRVLLYTILLVYIVCLFKPNLFAVFQK